MREWWLQRTVREQKLLKIVFVFVLILSIHFLILSPITNSIDGLKKNVADQRSLLEWMQSSIPRLESLRHLNVSEETIPTSAFLSTVDSSLSASGLKTSSAEMKQIDNNTVQLKFKSIGFDDLIAWLINLEQSYNIIVDQVSLNKNKEVGHVEGELVLSTT